MEKIDYQTIMIKIKNSVEGVYELLVQKILDLTLKPGEVVTEFSVSEKFGIGRTPVREALKRLESEGLIQTRNRTKTIQMLQPKDLEEIFDIKILLESAVAGMAAIRGTALQREQLRLIIGSMESFMRDRARGQFCEEECLQEWLALDRSFHALIFEMAGNERITKIIANLNLQWHRFKVGLMAIGDRLDKALGEHYSIGMAIIDQNPAEAENAMREHLSSLKKVLSSLMKTFAA